MTQKILRILLVVAIAAILIFVGVIMYQILHPSLKIAVTGSSDFPAVNLLSEEIDTDSGSLIKAILQESTVGKFNPMTAYILNTGYKKTPQADGTMSFQFYITIPEVKSTYQIDLTTGFSADQTINLVCAPVNLQPNGSNGCYKPPDDDLSYVSNGVVYA